MAEFLIAAATSDGVHIDEHFGRAAALTIYAVDADGNLTASGTRAGLGDCTCGGKHDEKNLGELIGRLRGCGYVLARRIGPGIRRALAAHDISAFELDGTVERAARGIAAFEKKKAERLARRSG